METTTFESLPLELYQIIVSNLEGFFDNLSARLVNTTFHKTVGFMKLRKRLISDAFTRNQVRQSYQLGKHRCKCINAECEFLWSAPTQLYTPNAIGLTTFYYPEDLLEPHDYDGDPYGPNYEFPIRARICRESPSVIRHIPYCEQCMIEYVNFGSREDELEVPYDGGGVNGAPGSGLQYGTNNF